MFSVLPDLTPRDSHSLWYTSTRNPNLTPSPYDPNHPPDNAQQLNPHNHPGPGPRNNNRPAAQAAIIERSVLGRLRADEIYMERRRQNVANMGSAWLKPPGVGKTLFQLREERREAEEHAESVRREMLVQELAEAEAAGVAATLDLVGGGMGGAVAGGVDGMVDDVDDPMMGVDMEDEEEEQDLDDEIPDADDDGGFGLDGVSDDEEEEEEESEEEEEGEEDEEESEGGLPGADDTTRQQRQELANRMAAMRATEDRMRELLAMRGTASHTHHPGDGGGGGDPYGADEDLDEEDQADILEEDDLLHDGYDDDMGPGMEDDLDMDANLDDDIPEAESGGYEHTDSEAELSSDEDEDEDPNISYALPGSARHLQTGGRNPAPRISSSGPYVLPPYSRQQEQQHQRQLHRQNRSSLASAGQRSSLDISGLLSRDGSSVIGSSPRMRRLN